MIRLRRLLNVSANQFSLLANRHIFTIPLILFSCFCLVQEFQGRYGNPPLSIATAKCEKIYLEKLKKVAA